MSTTIAHPTYPLQHEMRAAIIIDGTTQKEVERIQREFAHRRDDEFPGWKEKYLQEVAEWAVSHRANKYTRS